jgi:hypothetical protein
MKAIRFVLMLTIREAMLLILIGAIILLAAAAWEYVWPSLLP